MKNGKIIYLLVLCAVLLLTASYPDTAQAAATGYTDHGHTWSPSGKNDNCQGSNDTATSSSKYFCISATTNKGYTNNPSYTTTSCTTCGGDGIVSINFAKSGTTDDGFDYKSYTRYTACSKCGVSGAVIKTIYYSTSTYGGSSSTETGTGSAGTGKFGKCSHCNGTGYNYKCTHDGCQYGSYNAWESYTNHNKVCYTTENTYTIAFNSNGGSGSMASMTGCKYSSSYTLTANGYSRTGYTFNGWNTKADGTGTAYANKASVSKLSATNGATVTLYAQWKANTYTVTYNANGGSGAPATQSFTFGSGAALSSTKPTRTGYTFVHWVAAHDTSYTFNPGDSIPSGWGSFTLNAVWTPCSYKITFNPNGGNLKSPGTNINSTSNPGNSVTVTYDSGSYWSMRNDIPERKGYRFLGWYTASSGGTQVYDASGCCTNEGTYWSSSKWCYTGNVTLYAHWEHDIYTVTYDANGGSSGVGTVTNYYGEAVDLSVTASKPGYIFVGWNTDPDASGGLSSMTMPEEDVYLYAIYSIPVSDVKEVYLMLWPAGDEENYSIHNLNRTEASNMAYTYALELTEEVPEGFGYAVIVSDNAGNYSTLIGTADPPKEYIQTVEHYRKDMVSGEWVLFDTVSEKKLKGDWYTPGFITPPEGYRTDSIDEAYEVEGDTISRAYYTPNSYKLSFDANGGICSVEYKNLYYGDYYGELPTAERKGYTFLGWYTEREGGTQIKSTDKYLTAGESTLYAHWQIKSYQVIYDYYTNGGSRASVESQNVNYGARVDLSVKAYKDGWDLVGWNTDPDANQALSELTMGDNDIVLYAVFKKDITVTFIDRTDTGIMSRTQTLTIFNREVQGYMEIPAENEWIGWKPLGWSLSTEADVDIHTSAGSSYPVSENLTLYGRYAKDITLEYDTNGAAAYIRPQTGTVHYNAADVFQYPKFVLAAAPERSGYSFIAWQDQTEGINYNPDETVEFSKNTILTAGWDKFPEIEAYDRYFTLEEAQSGQITEEALLSKVKGTDNEDGVLVNGSDVIVKNYDSSVFTGMTADSDVEITYQAADSFGNTVSKTVTVRIVDTSVKVSNKVTYVRFLSSRFYKNENGYLAPEQGGLENTSIWRTNPAYSSLMDAVMSNKKVNQTVKTISLYGVEKEYTVPGSGEWEHLEESWYFTKKDLSESRDFTEQYGYGSSKVSNYVEKFMEWFGHCKK